MAAVTQSERETKTTSRDAVVGYLGRLPGVRSWPELRDLVDMRGRMDGELWNQPIRACHATGGVFEDAVPVSAAVFCLTTAIRLLDDMLDADPQGFHHRCGEASAANFAAAFQALGLAAVTRSELSPARRLACLESLNHAVLCTAQGQHLDLAEPADEDAYWRVIRTKSSPFYGAAFHVGAVAGGATGETAEEMRRFGELYGEIVQITDDLRDSMALPASPDWAERRSPLPILFARLVHHPSRERFLELRDRIAEGQPGIEEAQTILVRCGAVSYCVDQLSHRHEEAVRRLSAMSLAEPAELEEELRDLARSIEEIFEE